MPGLSFEAEDVGDRSEAEHARSVRFAAGLALVAPELVPGEGAALWVVGQVARAGCESSSAGLAPRQLAPYTRSPTGRKASDVTPHDAKKAVLVSRGLTFLAGELLE